MAVTDVFSPSAAPFRLATVTPEGLCWSLKRNCSASPAQVGAVFAGLVLVSLGVAVFFWRHGATLVLPFTLLELVALAVALVVYARHAADAERICLLADRVRVELEVAGRCTVVEFAREWVQVRGDAARGSLVSLSASGRQVSVGRHLRPPQRATLLSELRRALREARDMQKGFPPPPDAQSLV